MLEDLRMYMMERVFIMKAKGQGWGNQICPAIRELVNEIKKSQRHYQVLPSGLNQFEVKGTRDAYEVHLERRTCSCSLWQLNGMGCVHFIAAMSYMNRDVESYVDKIFSSITYMKAYKFRLTPMNGSNLWPTSEYTPPLPPIRRTLSGRPATKRKKDSMENQSSNKSKKSNQTQGNDGGEAVDELDQAVNEGGEAFNEGEDNVNVSEVHVQQDYDEVELTPIATFLNKIRWKKSETIFQVEAGQESW
ncbi:unnamed protein product [Lactuca saligna]|uniref:SWIM-type domain-containing protein n=1 Tax=Lactuca saligna TaxID=75948 RepID=A0AA35VF11_LACSI|nr:unnamed protein product [Lactuca saligna]